MLKLLKVAIALPETLQPFLPHGKTREKTRNKRVVRKQGEHYFIAGKTGMGKTRATKAIIAYKLQLEPYLNVYHLDTKHLGDYTKKDGIVVQSFRAPQAFKTQGNRLVWQPTLDDIDAFSEFFLNILYAGMPAIVNIDESINMKFGERIPRGLSILLSQGRLPGISVLGGSQELAKVPRQLLSQAKHLLFFNLTNSYDENMALHYLKLHNQKTLGLKQYEFYYFRPETDDNCTLMHTYDDLLSLMKNK
jgi:hypothetical protein